MKYLDLATQIAMADIHDHSKNFVFACVAIRQDGALITATNIRTQLPMPEAHCESRGLRKAGHGATLYLVRLNRNGNWAMAKPCQTCWSLIKNRAVNKLYYTVSHNTYAVWQP